MNIKNVRKLKLQQSVLTGKGLPNVDLVNLFKRVLKEINVSYNDECCDDIFRGDIPSAADHVVANRQTSSYILQLSDDGKLVEMNVASANTLTIPPNSSVAFPIGTQIMIAQYGAGQTTVTPGSGVTLNSSGGKDKLAAQYSGGSIIKIGTDEWYLFGDIVA